MITLFTRSFVNNTCEILNSAARNKRKCSYIALSNKQPLIANQVYRFQVIPVRRRNKFKAMPPGMTFVEPKSIPYVNPELRLRTRGKGLLVIPIILFGLGTWQVKRWKWKTAMIATIEEKTSRDPIPLELPLEPEKIAELEYQRVVVTGTFDHKNEILYGPRPCLVNGEPNREVISKTGEGSYGYNLVTPMVLKDTGERILVNRGWIQTKMVPKDQRLWSRTEGEQTITGLIRTTEPPRSIGPSKKLKYKVWHYRDIPDMAEAKKCLPIFIDATAEHSIPNLLWGGQTVLKLTNNHLSYLLTWYTLSIATGVMWFMKYAK